LLHPVAVAVKSKAQRRKFADLLVNKEIEPDVYERWNREDGRKELPERVRPKKRKRTAHKKRSPKRTRTKKARS
jgi:hypothetical protein